MISFWNYKIIECGLCNWYFSISAGLVAKPVGHASATTYGNFESSKGPRTSGGQFQPGVWGKQLDQQKKNDTEKYEPESWKPS